MFAVGDRVEVTVEGDIFYQTEGLVKEAHKTESGWRNYGVLMDNTEDIGNPWMWFSHDELRKVEA